MKMVVNYLNFVFLTEVKANLSIGFLNFVFQFNKNTKWHFGYTGTFGYFGYTLGTPCTQSPFFFFFFDKLKYES